MSEKERSRSLIVPIFIPFEGCPHRCVFCEQKKITSQTVSHVDARHIRDILDTAVNSKNFNPERNPEIAFYGGTFTSLPMDRMKEVLSLAFSYIKDGRFASIRISTRPDAIYEEKLEVLMKYGVKTVELGVQSMDDRVLSLSKRGHTSEDTIRAVRLLKDYGFHTGIQLMPGLPGDSREIFRKTTALSIDLAPETVRLYPALVIKGTELAALFSAGMYQPLELYEAIDICIDSCVEFESNGIKVIRIGLMSSPSLLEHGQILGGPWHTAFGFLVRSGIYLRNMEPLLVDAPGTSFLEITASHRDIPLIRGYKNQGLAWIKNKTNVPVVSIVADNFLPSGKVRIKKT